MVTSVFSDLVIKAAQGMAFSWKKTALEERVKVTFVPVV